LKALDFRQDCTRYRADKSIYQTTIPTAMDKLAPEANSAELETTKSAWYQATADYGRPDLRKSLCQVVDTLMPYFALWAAMVYMVKQHFPYWLILLLAIVEGGILVRVFALFHDCCHGSFFASSRANTAFGYVTGILTFTAFEDWRRAHNSHHSAAADLDRRGVGAIWTMTTEEYLGAPLRRRFAYRFYRNPFILLGPGAALLFLFFQRFSSKGAGKRERTSVLRTNLALVLVVAVASWTIGLRTYILVQLPIILIAGSFGLWLFYIQHQFENVYWARHGFWQPMRVALEGSSYFKLPKILQWFTGNIGFHHVHHVRPQIPNYKLQRCHDEIAAFRIVKPLTLRSSLKSLRLSLCDERKKRLVSFGSLKAQ
jgi:omega-6 fatty acid desaturase (delta-12 desaturase)